MKKTENEMEQIQQGLERFLEHEVAKAKSQDEFRSREDELYYTDKDIDEDSEEYTEEEAAEDRTYPGEKSTQCSRKYAAVNGEKKMRGKKSKKKHSGLRKLLTAVIVIAALFLGGLYVAVGGIYGKMSHQETADLESGPLKSKGVYSVLLIGSDSRSTADLGRSDAMILLTVSNKTKTVRMTSLLRDMYVEIPGREGNRLNAAYAFGGPELLLKTVNQNFGTNVNRYVVVNFEAFAALVDAVGGVELELTNEEVGWVNAYLNEYNELRGMPMETDYLDTSLSGKIHLNGAQALAYCRNRFIGTDFGRTERQRKVLSAVIKKLPLAAVTNPSELVNGLFPNLTTNLSQAECMSLALTGGKLLTYEMVQDSLPLEGTYSNASIRGMSVLQVDFEANKAYLRKEIYGEG